MSVENSGPFELVLGGYTQEKCHSERSEASFWRSNSVKRAIPRRRARLGITIKPHRAAESETSLPSERTRGGYAVRHDFAVKQPICERPAAMVAEEADRKQLEWHREPRDGFADKKRVPIPWSTHRRDVTGARIQSKGRIRRSFADDTFPCQPHRGLSQEISSSPKIFMASASESATLEHLRCKLMLCWPLGHAKTIR